MQNKHTFALFFSNLAYYVARHVAGDVVFLSDKDLAFRVSKILRLKIRAEFILFDDSHNALCRLVSHEKAKVELELVSINKNLKPEFSLEVGVGLLKKKSFEDAIYFAAEVGVSKIIPLLSEKSHKEWLSGFCQKRLQSIILSAREQAKNFAPVELAEPVSLKDFSKTTCQSKYILDPEGNTLIEASTSIKSSDDNHVLLAIGPEGGFTQAEIEIFKAIGFKSLALTTTILTAPMALALGSGSLLSLLR